MGGKRQMLVTCRQGAVVQVTAISPCGYVVANCADHLSSAHFNAAIPVNIDCPLSKRTLLPPWVSRTSLVTLEFPENCLSIPWLDSDARLLEMVGGF